MLAQSKDITIVNTSDEELIVANKTLNNPVIIKVGLHEGPVIAVNANGVLDYFGRTVNTAARVQQQRTGGDIVLKNKLFAEMKVDHDIGAITNFTT